MSAISSATAGAPCRGVHVRVRVCARVQRVCVCVRPRPRPRLRLRLLAECVWGRPSRAAVKQARRREAAAASSQGGGPVRGGSVRALAGGEPTDSERIQRSHGPTWFHE